MTVAEHAAEEAEPHPLLAGASPAAVKRWLLPEDRVRFVTEYEAALDEARTSLDLAGVVGLVEQWRQLAVLQSDPGAFRAMVRRVAELTSGVRPPVDEPLAVTRTRTGI